MLVCTYISLLYVMRIVECYSSGRVTPSCTDMTPRHRDFSAQQTASPYLVISDQTSYKGGDEITVTLKADSTPFRGFMLQAHEVGGSDPVGSFAVTDVQAQILSCNGMPNSVTHTSNVDKTKIQGLWKAPPSGNLKDIEFRATFVQTFSTYWLGVSSSRVIYSGRSDPTISAGLNTTSRPTPPNSVAISRGNCGSGKVCLSQPSGCDPASDANCYFMSAKTSSNSSDIHFEMSGSSEGYIAMGFSNDRMMGNDDIYICGLDSTSAVQVQHAYSKGRFAPEILPLGNISNIQSSFLNGVISCSFTSRNPITTHRSATVNSLYYLMFAYGPSNNGKIQFHRSTFVSEREVDLSHPQTVSTNLPHIVKAHGALMLIAWMTTGSLGMLIARYLKAVTKGTVCCGKDLWFSAHVFLMSLSVAATIIAFILIFSHVRGWSGGAHPVLGCLVMILAFIQPLAAVFRCGPDHSWRFIFNWAHALNAVAIKFLAVAAIFTGLSIIDRTSDMWVLKVMGGFVGWEALLYLLQELHFRLSQKDAVEGIPQLMKMEVILLILFSVGNLPFLVAVLIGIGMS